ncbi:unnamed protein product [Prorocentrum cordatum]|uniref:Uncharacterized protein n=1 Tax=Prorocentrum cordatum TaxID=2364126 RepID=A0ABN9RHQ2_9DINO|nr:unnamed protein product [Polarella glacialis]
MAARRRGRPLRSSALAARCGAPLWPPAVGALAGEEPRHTGHHSDGQACLGRAGHHSDVRVWQVAGPPVHRAAGAGGSDACGCANWLLASWLPVSLSLGGGLLLGRGG